MGFNRLKGLLYIVSGMNAFSQLNYFSIDLFHLCQVKSADCMENSMYKLCFREQRCEYEFLSTKLCHSSLESSLSTIHSSNSCFEDLG